MCGGIVQSILSQILGFQHCCNRKLSMLLVLKYCSRLVYPLESPSIHLHILNQYECTSLRIANPSTRWMDRRVMKSKKLGGNHISTMQSVSATYVIESSISSYSTTFAHIRWKRLYTRVTISHGLGNKQYRIAMGVIYSKKA